ncbi:MAG: hypothetical protein ACRDYF_15980 [Acidimicrobiia bacterium]
MNEPATEEGRQALQGLRAIWAATGQIDTAVSPGDTPEPPGLGLECAEDERGCSVNVNFDAFAETVEPTTDNTEATTGSAGPGRPPWPRRASSTTPDRRFDTDPDSRRPGSAEPGLLPRCSPAPT